MKINKPWGFEEIWSNSKKYVGKILFIKKGHRLSLQHHEKKEEDIRIMSGEILFNYGKDLNSLKEIKMSKGDSFHIPTEMIHRMSALEDTFILEVSTPELKDVVRHSDDYGRVK